ncbi:XRE family transcriptional regulator [Photobacterium jeanii]|uniref:XRE family transcriptional regulator n=1 Tax=Photobacterium jeanii TaxID=858640 RepID=A0A178K5V0_9GAMM|nr:helix-turn-helix transcriptional regulator [Photobacterium jeanii]OAN12641.1 XRE family transcriptional regulator [Photobacterium jeanii]PST86578.1 XRE family transcriptional regulator [Photobacterium jeanii]
MNTSKLLIASKIREAREWKEITQVGMAKKLGVARQTYLDLESGKTEPRVSTLVKIAEVTERPLAWFLFEENTGCNPCDLQEDTQQLVNMLAEVPPALRARLIELNLSFISCWFEQQNKKT